MREINTLVDKEWNCDGYSHKIWYVVKQDLQGVVVQKFEGGHHRGKWREELVDERRYATWKEALERLPLDWVFVGDAPIFEFLDDEEKEIIMRRGKVLTDIQLKRKFCDTQNPYRYCVFICYGRDRLLGEYMLVYDRVSEDYVLYFTLERVVF